MLSTECFVFVSVTLPSLSLCIQFEGAELQEFDMTDMLLEQPDEFLEGERTPQNI